MELFQDSLFTWSLVLIIGFPLLVVLLTELVDRLKRRQHPLAQPLRLARNVVLPMLAALLLLQFILAYEDTSLLIRLVATLFWLAVMVVLFRVLQYVLTPSEGQPDWRQNVPFLLLQLPRFLLVLLIGYLILAQVWSVNVAGLVTALGVGSLVIALALQDTLSNLFSGLLLLLNRPFQVGDWIQSGEVEGQVREINWRTSLVRTRDNDLVVIPNGSIAKGLLKNYSRPTTLHRVKEE
ncbi:MAG: mechanosensitive ion channel family protein, partial [Chloroflexota bacterium]|nr:mechanosensitive ion channel family protein [Chloroflexota bacterium]